MLQGQTQLSNDFLHAARTGDLSTLNDCLEQDVNPAIHDNVALTSAAKYGHHQIVARLLKCPEVNPNAQNGKAIIESSLHGWANVVRVLLNDNRVDVAIDENSAICRAAVDGHFDIVEMILDHGLADPSAEDNIVLIFASSLDKLSLVERLLQDSRVDPTAQAHDALVAAYEKNHSEILHCIMKYRPNTAQYIKENYLDMFNEIRQSVKARCSLGFGLGMSPIDLGVNMVSYISSFTPGYDSLNIMQAGYKAAQDFKANQLQKNATALKR